VGLAVGHNRLTPIQAAFIEGRRIVDDAIIFKTNMGKYLRARRV
jgi:hypothetical protein